MNSDWWYEADSEADYEVDGYGGTTPTSRLRDLFVVLPKGGLGDLIDGKEAKQYYKELRLKHQQHQHLQENPERDIFLGLREPELKKCSSVCRLDG